MKERDHAVDGFRYSLPSFPYLLSLLGGGCQGEHSFQGAKAFVTGRLPERIVEKFVIVKEVQIVNLRRAANRAWTLCELFV